MESTIKSRVGLGALIAGVLFASIAYGQSPARSAEKEQRIEDELASAAPEAVRAFHDATVALDQGKFDEASRLFRQVLTRAPRFMPALRRLAGALASQGQSNEALKFAEQAVQLERSSDNLSTLAWVLSVSGRGNKPSEENLQRSLSAATESRSRSGRDEDAGNLILIARHPNPQSVCRVSGCVRTTRREVS